MMRLLAIGLLLIAAGCSDHPASSSSQTPAAGSQADHDAAARTRSASSSAANRAVDVHSSGQADHISASATVSQSSVAAGEELQLSIQIKVADGWHIYGLQRAGQSQPTQFRLTLPEGLSAEGDWEAPAPDTLMTSFGPAAIYKKEATFTRVIKVSGTASGTAAIGKCQIECEVAYQACDRTMCLPPQTVRLAVPLEVVRK